MKRWQNLPRHYRPGPASVPQDIHLRNSTITKSKSHTEVVLWIIWIVSISTEQGASESHKLRAIQRGFLNGSISPKILRSVDTWHQSTMSSKHLFWKPVSSKAPLSSGIVGACEPWLSWSLKPKGSNSIMRKVVSYWIEANLCVTGIIR